MTNKIKYNLRRHGAWSLSKNEWGGILMSETIIISRKKECMQKLWSSIAIYLWDKRETYLLGTVHIEQKSKLQWTELWDNVHAHMNNQDFIPGTNMIWANGLCKLNIVIADYQCDFASDSLHIIGISALTSDIC